MTLSVPDVTPEMEKILCGRIFTQNCRYLAPKSKRYLLGRFMKFMIGDMPQMVYPESRYLKLDKYTKHILVTFSCEISKN